MVFAFIHHPLLRFQHLGTLRHGLGVIHTDTNSYLTPLCAKVLDFFYMYSYLRIYEFGFCPCRSKLIPELSNDGLNVCTELESG